MSFRGFYCLHKEIPVSYLIALVLYMNNLHSEVEYLFCQFAFGVRNRAVVYVFVSNCSFRHPFCDYIELICHHDILKHDQHININHEI